MRVINKIEENGKQAECLCGAELEYLPSDTHAGAYGSIFITCPVCAKEILLDDEDPITLTMENLEWPRHFSMPDPEDIDIDDATIQRWVKTCLNNVSSDMYRENEAVTMESGNALVVAYKEAHEYVVYVTKSYAATCIPRIAKAE